MEKASEWLSSFNSNYQDEVNALISTKNEQRKHTFTMAITGGKGGVGKTSVSLKLAKELSDQGFKTLLIDCDYNLSNTAIKLGLPLSNTFYDLVSAQKSFDECIHRKGDFHLLAACNGSIDLFDTDLKLEEVIIDIINTHSENYDFVLLDCPAGLTRESLILNAYCDKRIVVVTPDRSSITDSYSMIKVLNKKFGINENDLLVNMVNSKGQFEKIVKTLSETTENFLNVRTKILGGIHKLNIVASQFDEYFLNTGNNGHHESFLKVVRKLSEELSNRYQTIPSQGNGDRGFFEQEVH